MWILDSLSEVQLKKPFLFLWIPLGAAFLLLAIFFSQNPLYHSATYSTVALATWLCWQKERTLLNGLIVPVLAIAAVLMVPNYLYLYAAGFSLLTGRLIFAENFRPWKGIASTALLLLSLPILQVWQEIPQLRTLFPLPVTQLIHAAVFAFCIQFSLLPYQIRKDSVIEAFGHYQWK